MFTGMQTNSEPLLFLLQNLMGFGKK